jgi:hypothetical protein
MFAYAFSMASLESVTTTVGKRSRHQKPTVTETSGGQPGFRKAVGMSAAALEEFLGLPSGAWKKRRLFVLRTMTDAHADAGIPKGAQIVVEPGARTAPGRLVLIKDGDALTVRRIDYDRNGHTVMRPAAPGMLPFPTEGSRKQVVGTIIGVLPRARVADRTVSSGRRPPKGPSAPKSYRQKAIAQADHENATAILHRNMDIWSRAYQDIAGSPNRGATARWRALAARLRVLASCLEVAHQKNLYGALAEEANRIVSTMRRELDRLHTPGREHLELLPESSLGTDTRPQSSAETQASPSDAAKRHCTEPPAAPLDTGLATML